MIWKGENMKTEVVVNKGIEEIKQLCAQSGISPMELSRYLNVTWTRIYEIISGKRRITPETDVLLCHFFEVELGHFAKLQLEYDLILAERSMQQKLTEIPTFQDTVKSKN